MKYRLLWIYVKKSLQTGLSPKVCRDFLFMQVIYKPEFFISQSLFILTLHFLLCQLSSHIEAHTNLHQRRCSSQEENIFCTELLPNDPQYS